MVEVRRPGFADCTDERLVLDSVAPVPGNVTGILAYMSSS